MRDRVEEIRSYLTGANRKITLLYLVSFLFIAANCYFVYREIYWFLFLPLGIVILFLYIYKLDSILFLITAVTPLAINIKQLEFNIGVSIPSEPLMFGVLVIFVLKLFYGETLNRDIWRHPLTILIGLQLFWMLITSFTSDLPLVSFKHLLARLWFVTRLS